MVLQDVWLAKDPLIDAIIGKDTEEQPIHEINLSEDERARLSSDPLKASIWCSENYESEDDREKCVASVAEENGNGKKFRGHAWELISFKAAFLILLYLTLAVDYNMIVSSLTDPGILPARIWPTWVHEKYTADPIYDESSWSHAPINTVSYLQVSQLRQGHIFRLKFCQTCRIFRPARTLHCGRCSTCVLEFDHHCNWLGTCLGRRNYRSFYWFVNYLFFLSLWLVVLIGMLNWRVTGIINLIEDGKFELHKHKFVFIYGVMFIYTLIVSNLSRSSDLSSL